MTGTAVADDEVEVTPPRWWETRRALWWSALVLLVGLCGLAPLVADGDGIAYPDEGLYALQVKNLVEGGSWSAERPAAYLPGFAENNGIGPEVTVGDRYFAYTRHALLIVALAPLYRAAGFTGMLFLSVFGVWLAALLSGLLARRIQPRLAVPTLVLVGIGSPLVFDAFLVAGHGLAAATTAGVALGVSVLVEDRRWWPLLTTLPLVALTVMLRTEGVVVMGSVAAVVGAVSLLGSVRDRAPHWQGIATSGGVFLTAYAAFRLDAAISVSLTGVAGADNGSVDRILGVGTGPWDAVWASLLRPWYSATEGNPAVVLAGLALLLAVVGARFLPSRSLLALGASVLAVGSAVTILLSSASLVTGLLPAFPVLVACLAVGRDDVRHPIVARHLGVAGLSAVVLVLSIYRIGGAAEWGGRFFHILLPLLGPVVVLGLSRILGWIDRRTALAVIGACVLVSGAFSVRALRVNHRVRDIGARAATEIVTLLRGDRTKPKPLVVLTGTSPGGISRSWWNEMDVMDLLVGRELGEGFFIARAAARSGVTKVQMLVNLPPDRVEMIGAAWFEDLDWGIVRAQPMNSLSFVYYEFRFASP